MVPGIQKLVNDSDFFDYSQCMQPEQRMYEDYLDPSKKTHERHKVLENSYTVTFSGKEISVVVGIVDMVDSTKICADLGPRNAAKFYQIFINSMSKIISYYGGIVIKNIGDCLLYYFPYNTTIGGDYFENSLNISNALLESRDKICDHLLNEKLPSLNYRVSLDYGNVIMMDANLSSISDMIGPPINMCAKINRLAHENELVIGGDLYEIVKKKREFRFKSLSGYYAGLRYSYPAYRVSKMKYWKL